MNDTVTIRVPHWKQEAYQLFKDMEPLVKNYRAGGADILAAMANMGNQSMKILAAALKESPSETENQAWSEGVRFAVLHFAKAAEGTLQPFAINLISESIVRMAVKVKANSMEDSTELKRLISALAQVVEILDDAPEGLGREEDCDRLLQAKDEALAILTDALEEARPQLPQPDSGFAPLD